MKLLRVSGKSDKHGTRGVFVIDDVPMAISYELPWLDNKRMASCIPEGEYPCIWEKHSKFRAAKMIVRVHKVEGRDGILIHPGNKLSEIQGCILPGKSFKNADFIEYSTHTLERLGVALDWQPFLLRICWV